MSNLHTPKRLEGETFAAYKKRRVASREAAKLLSKPESVPFARYSLAQTRNRSDDKFLKRQAGSARQYRLAIKAARRISKDETL